MAARRSGNWLAILAAAAVALLVVAWFIGLFQGGEERAPAATTPRTPMVTTR